jgi:hypothetical protein
VLYLRCRVDKEDEMVIGDQVVGSQKRFDFETETVRVITMTGKIVSDDGAGFFEIEDAAGKILGFAYQHIFTPEEWVRKNAPVVEQEDALYRGYLSAEKDA